MMRKINMGVTVNFKHESPEAATLQETQYYHYFRIHTPRIHILNTNTIIKIKTTTFIMGQLS